MSKKFIPNGDVDFLTMAESFARNIAADPQRFEVSQDDARTVTTAAERFRAAMQACRFNGRSPVTTQAKEDARADVERIIRRLGHLVRTNARLDAATKMVLGIHPRVEKGKVHPCPQEPPRLRFVRALHESGATPVHELEFKAVDWANAKPPGAVRLELFVDLVPPDEPIPEHPGANYGSRPWYLRSYTRSPIKLIPPMARVPMRVVYWGRWADALGEVGPFSATAVAWVEGGSHAYLPGAPALALAERKPVPILDAPHDPGPAGRERTYVVAVLEAQYQSLAGETSPQLPAPAAAREQRQIEGPAERAA